MDRTDCARVAPLLEPYADGALPEVLAAGVEAHLLECTHCARTVVELTAVYSSLAGWPTLTSADHTLIEARQEPLAAYYRACYPEAGGPAPAGAPRAPRKSPWGVLVDRLRPVPRFMLGALARGGKAAARAGWSFVRVQRTRNVVPAGRLAKPHTAPWSRSAFPRRAWSLLARSAAIARRVTERGALALG